MANFIDSPITIEESTELLRTDVKEWNKIRKAHPYWCPCICLQQSSDFNETYSDKWHDNYENLDLQGVNLRGVNLSKAHLIKVNLTKANLQKANFQKAYLFEVNLHKTDLRRANFVAALLSKTNLSGANLFEAEMGNLIAPDSDFRDTNLTSADIGCAALHQSNFRNANLSKVDLRGTHLTDRYGNGVDFTNAIFENTLFSSEEDYQFPHLAATKGLETATFDDPQFLPNYLNRTFAFVHKQRPRELQVYPELYKTILQNIKCLNSLYTTEEPSPALIEVVNVISAELISYLAKNPSVLNKFHPRQFEELIAEILLSFGWEVQLTPQSKDGGYDLFAISKDIAGVKTSWIIECKQYSQERKVGVEIARGLYGVKLDLRVANAMLATTSHFTKGVHDFKSSRYDFELRDYEGILEWINNYRPNPEGKLYIHNNKLKIS